jgi:hypothetical protein
MPLLLNGFVSVYYVTSYEINGLRGCFQFFIFEQRTDCSTIFIKIGKSGPFIVIFWLDFSCFVLILILSWLFKI